MAFISIADDVSLFVQDLGDGHPVVLVPGFGLDHTTWDRQVRALCVHGYRVLALDQRGHGVSDKPLDGYEVSTLAADLATVLEARDVTQATVVGHSFGGQVGFALAAQRPDLVKRLVLVGSNGVRASRSDQFRFGARPETILPGLVAAEVEDRVAARRATLVSAFGSEPSEELVRLLLRVSLRLPSWGAVACYKSMLESDLVDRIDEVQQPVLQVTGANDPVHSAPGARWLNGRLRHSTLVELSECGHYPMYEVANAFEHALLDFLGAEPGR